MPLKKNLVNIKWNWTRSLAMLGLVLVVSGIAHSCKEEVTPEPDINATPYPTIDLPGFGKMPDNPNNPMTVEGVDLGRHLFYDSILSKNYTVSCASCHKQEFAFSDPVVRSKGVHGGLTLRHSMALFNVGYDKGPFFWDGRAMTLEDQVVQPVFDPIEMDLPWDEAVERLKNSNMYKEKFAKAFPKAGDGAVSQENAGKAIAQFVRSIVSYDTKFDRYQQTKDASILTPLEYKGFKLFVEDPDLRSGSRDKSNPNSGVDCGHCHAYPTFQQEPLFNALMNNGVPDIGGPPRAMKTPSLRNLAYTAPYMHSGNFPNIDSVIAHYDHKVRFTPQLDANMYLKMFVKGQGTMELDATEIQALKAYLNTLNDEKLLTDPRWSNPFKP